MNRPSVIFIDVDDTLVRSVGSTRIPMPEVIRQVRSLHENGHMLYLWSSGGADYARRSGYLRESDDSAEQSEEER